MREAEITPGPQGPQDAKPAVRVLGQAVAVSRPRGPVPVTGLAGLLLAGLSARPNTNVMSAALASLLWRESPPATSSASLQMHISRLRKAIDGVAVAVSTVVGGYRLDVLEDQLDVLLVERSLADGRRLLATDPEAALELFGRARDLCSGVPYAPFDDVAALQGAVAHARRLAVEAQELWGDAGLAAGLHREMLCELEAAAEREPFREHRWAQLMLGLYRTGRQADALAAYRRARRVLIDELGIEPGPALRRLEEAVLVQNPSLDLQHAGPTAPIAGAQVPLPCLVGREREISVLLDRLGDHRLITVLGPPGVGKTAVALAVARQAPGARGLQCRVVTLAAVDRGDRVLGALADALDLTPGAEVTDLFDAIVDSLSDRSSLLVFDNVEQVVIETAQLVQNLLSALPDLRILTTSRIRLGLDYELCFRLDPLSLEGADDVENGGRSPAVALLQERVSTVRGFNTASQEDGLPGAHLQRCTSAETSAATEPDLVAVARRLDGLPLALELAAPLIATIGCEAMLATLDAEPGAGELSDRLAETISSSLAALPEMGRRVASAVAVLPGPLDVELVANIAGIGVAHATTELARLAEASLVHPATVEGRVRMLRVIRDGILARINSAELAGHVSRALTTLTARAARHGVAGFGTDSAIETELGVDSDNLRAALHMLVDAGDLRRAVSLTANLTWLLGASHRYYELVPLARRVKELAERRLDHPSAGAALGIWALAGATFAWSAEHLPEAEHGLKLSRAAGDQLGLFAGTMAVGIGLGWRGEDLDRAEACFVSLEEHAEAWTGNPYWVINGTELRGLLRLRRGEFEEGRRLLRVALQRFEDLGSSRGVSRGHSFLGTAAVLLDDLDEAERHFDKVVEVAPRTADRLSELHAKVGLARVAARRGCPEVAAARFREAAARLSEIGDIGCAVDASVGLAEATLEMGERAASAAVLITMLRRAHQRGEQGPVVLAAALLAGMALDDGQPEPAARLVGIAEAMVPAGRPVDPHASERLTAVRNRLHDVLGADRLAAARAAGAGEDPAEVLAELRLFPDPA